jgi:hypothetical protein
MRKEAQQEETKAERARENRWSERSDRWSSKNSPRLQVEGKSVVSGQHLKLKCRPLRFLGSSFGGKMTIIPLLKWCFTKVTPFESLVGSYDLIFFTTPSVVAR